MRPPSTPTVIDTAPGLWRSLTTIIHKDLLLEWRAKSRLNATLFFALLTLLLFSFAVGPDHRTLSRNAPGYIWLAMLLASVLSLSESLRVEWDNHAMEGLRLLPVDARGLFLGKAAVNTLFLTLLAMILIPAAIALYDTSLHLSFGWLWLIMFLGSAAISAPGTLFAAIVSQGRAKDVLLPLLLFPILIPGLVSAVKATSLVFFGDPMHQLTSWIGLLGAFNAVYWPLCGLLFGRVIEE